MSPNPPAEAHHELVEAVARLEVAQETAALQRALGLHRTHVGCEDSVRWTGPMRGVQIGDVTLRVHSRRQGQQFATSMPVLRAPDFADRCVALPIAAIAVRVGNHRGEPLRTIGLDEYLGDLQAHLSRPDGSAGGSLFTGRDEHVEVRAQACCVPVPRDGQAVFTPLVCPPRAWPGAPALLAIVATREGTSATVVDLRRDVAAISGRAGQVLLHNRGGQRTSFTVEDAAPTGAVLVIQVPLRQPPPPPDPHAHWDVLPIEPPRGVHAEKPVVIDPRGFAGPYVELDGLTLARDQQRPICVTVQFYRPVGAPESDDTLVELGALIERVYREPSVLGPLIDAR